MAAGVGDEPAPAPGLPGITSGFIHPTAPHAGLQLVQGKDCGRPFDEVYGNGWRLVVLGTDVECIGRNERAWFESIGGRAVALVDPDPHFVRWFAEHDTTCALQRPDFYLYGTAPAAEEATTLLADLRHHLVAGDHHMKIANHGGRAALVIDGCIEDVHAASGGRFGPDPMSVYADWPAFVDFATGITVGSAPLMEADLRLPVPAPRQVFAIGLNYRSHAEESGMAVPSVPATFTKFPSSLSGPFDDIEIVGGTVDWEVELVAVIGIRADRVDEADAWSHVAGLTIGQDVSDRTLQFAAGSQFSLGKSAGATGQWGLGSSRSTRCPTPTTSRWVARSMVRRCRTRAPQT